MIAGRDKGVSEKHGSSRSASGACGMTWSTRCAAVCAMRRAPHDGQNPRRLQENTASLSWPQSPQRRRRNPWATDAALQEGVELVLHELRQVSAGDGFGEEGRGVLLHQAVQRGLLGAVALVVDRGTIGRPLGCRPMACTKSSRGGELVRSQVGRHVSIAPTAAYRCALTSAEPPSCGSAWLRIDRTCWRRCQPNRFDGGERQQRRAGSVRVYRVYGVALAEHIAAAVWPQRPLRAP